MEGGQQTHRPQTAARTGAFEAFRSSRIDPAITTIAFVSLSSTAQEDRDPPAFHLASLDAPTLSSTPSSAYFETHRQLLYNTLVIEALPPEADPSRSGTPTIPMTGEAPDYIDLVNETIRIEEGPAPQEIFLTPEDRFVRRRYSKLSPSQWLKHQWGS